MRDDVRVSEEGLGARAAARQLARREETDLGTRSDAVLNFAVFSPVEAIFELTRGKNN